MPALLGRAIVGIGSGAGFVAGLDLVRSRGGGSVLQDLYGGATIVGGGFAATGLSRVGHIGEGVLREVRLLPLGVLHAATFGLAVVAGNWAVPLLELQGASSAAAGLAGGADRASQGSPVAR